VVKAIETVFADLGIPANGANPWFYPSVAVYASLLEKYDLEVREAALFERPTNWKMASTVWKCGSRCSVEHFWIVCRPTGEVSFCAQWSGPRALPSGRPITGNSITADSASPPRKLHRSTRKN